MTPKQQKLQKTAHVILKQNIITSWVYMRLCEKLKVNLSGKKV